MDLVTREDVMRTVERVCGQYNMCFDLSDKRPGSFGVDMPRAIMEIPTASKGNYAKGYNDCKESLRMVLKNRIKELESHPHYPHNFMGQMVDDFEWVLTLLKDGEMTPQEGTE